MKIKRSVVLTTIVPEAIADAEIFKATAKQLGRMGISTIEFYTPFERAAKYGKILNASGLDIYRRSVPKDIRCKYVSNRCRRER